MTWEEHKKQLLKNKKFRKHLWNTYSSYQTVRAKTHFNINLKAREDLINVLHDEFLKEDQKRKTQKISLREYLERAVL